MANGVIIADAVAVVPDDALPNTATWEPTIVTSGDYEVHGKWPAHANHPSFLHTN
ncbi:MAG: hypothetical protein O2999_00135 [Nitrospirae bacterium]|nr:hypothetical protein [Nitrospirota bacterium]MDA1302715.1 hypothetical protein [Nitrospirota bacterium]